MRSAFSPMVLPLLLSVAQSTVTTDSKHQSSQILAASIALASTTTAATGTNESEMISVTGVDLSTPADLLGSATYTTINARDITQTTSFPVTDLTVHIPIPTTESTCASVACVAIQSALATTQTGTANVQACLTLPGGLQTDNTTAIGCKAIFQHMTSCYEDLSPWTDPYNATQSIAFQHCFCETSDSVPFSPDRPLFRNYTACAECLHTNGNVIIGKLSQQQKRFDIFCSAPQPLAYLFLIRNIGWLASLHVGVSLADPALSAEITEIGRSLGPMFTTTPPLANRAWGASAPWDGSLKEVEPELTTYTSTVTNPGSFLDGETVHTATVTSLVRWKGTKTGAPDYDEPHDSATAAAAASSALEAAMASLASSMLAAAPSQGGGRGEDCTARPGSCSTGAAAFSLASLQALLSSAGMWLVLAI